jgi:cytidylate kinase
VTAKGETTPVEQVIAQVAARDARDKHNTLVCDDAVVLDGTHIDAAAVLAEAVRIVEMRILELGL